MENVYRSILVANEKLSGLTSALDKAAQLEHYSGAELTLLEVVYDALEMEDDDVLPRSEKERLINAYMAAERHALTEIANCFKPKVASLATAVAWSERREIGICKYALQHNVDLIIKPQDTDRSALNVLFDSSAHSLLAHAACPILLSKVKNWDDSRAILACVDIADPMHGELNQRITRNAVQLAKVLDLPLHLLNVAPLPKLSLGRFSSTFDVAAMQERMLARRENALESLKNDFSDYGVEVFGHVKAGHLVSEIGSLADHIGANVVVMGTASREGLRRFLIGNSAEAVLNRLELDLLCVKEDPLAHTEYGD